MTRSRDLSNDQANVGGAVAPFVAGKNFVINGGMDNWQRGTSFSLAASTAQTYIADRWCFGGSGANEATTLSRQATGDTTNLPNIQYCMRFQRNSGQTGTGGMYIAQSFETVNSIPMAGKTVTLSFYARAGANYSAASNVLGAVLITGTGTDQNIAFSYTGASYPIVVNATLTTTWQRFTYTATLSSSATEIAMYFSFTPTGTAGANDYFEITGVQLEQGSVATPFARAAGTLQGELALCQRYYYTLATGANKVIGSGNYYTASNIYATIAFPVTMRTNPTIDQVTGTDF